MKPGTKKKLIQANLEEQWELIKDQQPNDDVVAQEQDLSNVQINPDTEEDPSSDNILPETQDANMSESEVLFESLTPAHQIQLESQYALDIEKPDVKELIARKLIRSVTKEETNTLLGRNDIQSGGILIVYPNDPNTFTIRLNKPLTDPESGKRRKYLRPAGQENRLYIPMGLDYEDSPEIWVTEGEMKAISGYQAGLPVVSLSGIWNWRTDKGTLTTGVQKLLGGGTTSSISDELALNVDLDRDWSGKRIVLLYDSDIDQHHSGWPAFGRLAEQLYRLGAEEVRIFTLPKLKDDDKTGLDDLINHGKQENIPLKDLIAGLKKKIYDSPVWVPTKGGVEKFTEIVASKSNPIKEEILMAVVAKLISQGEMLADEYAQKFGKGKTMLLKAAKARAKEVKKRQKGLPPLGKGLESLAPAVNGIIAAMSQPPASPKEIIKNHVFEKIRDTFEKEGDFFSSKGADGEAWWFFKNERKMLGFGEVDFETLFTQYTGLSKKSEFGSDSLYRLYSYAYQKGEKIEPRRIAYYDETKNLLYLDQYNGEILRLDGRIIETVTNGTDGIFFVRDRGWQPWEYVQVTEKDKKLFTKIMTGVNFSRNAKLEPACAKVAIMAWRMAGFFRERQPTRPYLLFRGEKDSGKSSLARYWLWLLFGVGVDVSTINTDNLDQFLTVLTNQPWVCIDNLDGSVKKIEDILATAATGGTVPKRVLYTTNQMANYPIVSWFTITSRTPRFRRDDIADRLLVIELSQIKKPYPEGKIKRLLSAKRNNYLSVLVQMLNEMVSYFGDYGWPKNSEHFRMADFATFLRAYLRYSLGEEMGDQVTDRTLYQLGQAQAEFQIQDDTLLNLLLSLVQKGCLVENKKYFLDEVLSAVNGEAVTQDLKFSIGSTHTLGSMLRQRSQAARVAGKLQIEVVREVTKERQGTHTLVQFFLPQGLNSLGEQCG